MVNTESENILYLFNSGSRDGYSENVFRTMFFPGGCCNEYRYRTPRNLSEGCLKQLSKLKEGASVVIIFIDRYADGGYRFIPLRQAKYCSRRREGDQVFFAVELGGWLSPMDLCGFNEKIRSTLGPKNLPRLTNGAPENKDDGYYAIIGPYVFDKTVAEDAAWTKTVDALFKTTCFRKEKNPLFLRCQMKDRKGGLLKCGPEKGFKLFEDKEYVVNLYYKVQKGTGDMSVEVSVDDTARLIGEGAFPINMASNSKAAKIRIKKHPDVSAGAITIDENNSQQRWQFTMTYYLGWQWWKYLTLLLLVLLFGLFSAISLDLTKFFSSAASQPAEWWNIMWNIGVFQSALVRFIAGILQLCVILGAIKLLGKKLL